jgi:hypothetical protein
MCLKYCKQCQEDIYRLEMGYSTQEHDIPCKQLSCKILDYSQFLIFIILLPMFILFAIILLIISIIIPEKGFDDYD